LTCSYWSERLWGGRHVRHQHWASAGVQNYNALRWSCGIEHLGREQQASWDNVGNGAGCYVREGDCLPRTQIA